MRHTLRPYSTAGVAIIGAGLIAAIPVAASLPDIQTRGVTLATGESSLPDLLAPWIDQFNTASANLTTLTNNFSLAPGVGLQQMIANMSGYLQVFFDDPSSGSVTAANGQIQDNLASVLTGYGLQNESPDTFSTVTAHTLDGLPGLQGAPLHAFFFGEVPGYIPADEAATATPIINFLASPASGILMGELGPSLSPWIALMNSISDGDDLNTTLANMVGAYFNGADLSLNSLIPAIEQLGLFPAGMNLENLDIAFGGLLTPGDVGPDSGVGGSIFNSLGFYATGVPGIVSLNIPGQAVGPLGAWEGWAQTVAALLGWDGSGAPLTGVTFPTIPDDFFDDSGAGNAVADVATWVQDLVSSL